MNFSAPFVRRPVATTLLTLGVALAGLAAYFQLPVSPLPQVDFPTITVSASMPGASPETMASSVATPLERHLGTIADVTEMTSSSSVGNTNVILQFGLSRDIDGAARDVQAAINAARADLPAALRSNPAYRKFNVSDQPILILALTSDTLPAGQLYDAAATILQQRLSQIDGVGDVTVGGSSLPAVRVELNPTTLFKYGIGLEDVRAALSAANANSPKGAIENDQRRWQIYSNDNARAAAEYRSLIVAYRNNAAVRLADVAEVTDSVEDIRNLGLADGKPAVIVIISRQPGANIISAVDRVLAELPALEASLPGGAKITVGMDRSTTIRASLRDVEISLVCAIVLVILVVFFFLRDWRATMIPSVAVPISLIGTFGVMYLLDYSVDNLSLMALTIATGFVVDDAIVVMENVVRHMEAGVPRFEATLRGVREVGFTVLSMSLSLIAVFIPILLMGGLVGRLFREFAVVLSISIGISMLVSLTTTPMMCARILGRKHDVQHGRLYRWSEAIFDDILHTYEHSLAWVLRHSSLMLVVFLATIGLNVWLFTLVPKGFFPEQDTGRLIGGIQADQSISFQLMAKKFQQFVSIVRADPAVQTVVGSTGAGGRGGSTNSGRLFVSLKPQGERKETAQQVIARLRPKLAAVPGATVFLAPAQEIRVGGRSSNALYQYTLQADNLADLRTWTPRLLEALKAEPILQDLNTDQQDKGLETDLVIDRDAASRLGLTASQIDNTLYDAFGQRQVSTIYQSLNQYHVVMGVAQRFWQDPSALQQIFISTSGGAVSGTQSTNAVAGTTGGVGSLALAATSARSSSVSSAAAVASDSARNARLNAIAARGRGGASAGQAVSTRAETMIPLSAIAHYETGTTPLAVNHQGQFAAATISFNLAEGASLSDATAAVNRQIARIGMPRSLHGSFQGTARTYQESISNEPVLILAAIVAIYIVLGVLYESYTHPFTILSTLPSAGLGAVLALMLFNTEFSLIALIGVFLLIGIVKKNAIMMIDFAIAAERDENLSPRDAIFRASLLRFRPILMTTMAALLAAVPLAIGFGTGAELRRPLGIAIVGGLFVSQLLTLYTTPVIYLYFDRVRLWLLRRKPESRSVENAAGEARAPA
jgi:multidrug efflux pump